MTTERVARVRAPSRQRLTAGDIRELVVQLNTQQVPDDVVMTCQADLSGRKLKMLEAVSAPASGQSGPDRPAASSG